MNAANDGFDLDRLLKARKVPDAPVDLSARIIAAAMQVPDKDRHAGDDLMQVAGQYERRGVDVFSLFKSPQFLAFCLLVMVFGGVLGAEVHTVTGFDDIYGQDYTDYEMFSEEWL